MKTFFIYSLLALGGFFCSDKETTYKTIVPSNNELTKSIARGKEVYADFCMQCHLGNGKGHASNPPLAGSDWLVNKRKESIHAVKYGQSGPIVVNGKTYNSVMSPMGLTDEEVADVMNYIMNSWGNKQSKMVTIAEVSGVKK
jgi:mono/diheme cytochrome c family protein